MDGTSGVTGGSITARGLKGGGLVAIRAEDDVEWELVCIGGDAIARDAGGTVILTAGAQA